MILRDPVQIEGKGQALWAHGKVDILDETLCAFLCSKACPGARIVEAMDLAQRWRAENRTVICGFHTPMERECLRVFLCGPQHLVICPARGLHPFQLPPEWLRKFQRNEILIVSPFDSSVRRPTRETAEIRTRLILALAAHRHIHHATPNGALERLGREFKVT